MTKTIRTILSVIISAMLISCLTVAAAADKSEISFSVGDDTLMINGEAVTVEKPYVVGDGVTLVPLRVITEAFGARVEWIAETKSVEITYPDVEILLQIDNKVAEVNGKAENLLSAPELTSGGFTMVPLRFISETFGADVSYDEATRKITVVKAASDNSATVEGSVNSTYVGDSYFGWHMENPKDMYMDYRSFDGTETSFSFDENNCIEISIWPVEEEYDFEKDFIMGKTSMSSDGYTLVKAEKDTSDPTAKIMDLQAKDKNEIIIVRRVVTDKYQIDVFGYFETEKTELRDEAIRIISTFKGKYRTDDIYDLSNAENGFRRFTADELNLSFNVPEGYFMSSYEDSQNEFQFDTLDLDDDLSMIVVNVYSKSDVGGADKLAQKDYNHNKKLINENISEFCDSVIEKEYDSIATTAYEYEYTMKSSYYDAYIRDTFFEIGEYVYNFTVKCKLSLDDYKGYADSIINSIEAKEIDSDKVGILLRSIPEATGSFNVEVGKATFVLPNNYYESVENNAAMFIDPVSGTSILVQIIPSVTNMNQARAALKEVEKNQKAINEVTVLSTTAEQKIGNNKYYTFVMKQDSDDGESVYAHQYATTNNGALYSISVACPEITYSEYTKKQFEDIIAKVIFK